MTPEKKYVWPDVREVAFRPDSAEDFQKEYMMETPESERDFLVHPDEDEWPYRWRVDSYLTHRTDLKPELVEAWPDEKTAIEMARIRHDQGYVVQVSKVIAFTIGE